MNDDTQKLLHMMADTEDVAVDAMLEKIIREAAMCRGLLDGPERTWTGGRYSSLFQHRDVQELSPDSAERMWRVRIASANSRARKLGISGELTYEGWIMILGQHGCVCTRCGSHEYLCIDHVVPLSLGGPNIDSNTQPLCRDCNSQKATAERIAPYFPKRQLKT